MFFESYNYLVGFLGTIKGRNLMKRFILFVVTIVFFANSTAFAWPRPSRTYKIPTMSSNYSSNMPVVNSKNYSYTSSRSDQERCQSEASYMAANDIRDHVGSCIGSFEGVGYGNSSNCSTCTPSNRMNLTGDASSRGKNGMWYRVRSWR